MIKAYQSNRFPAIVQAADKIAISVISYDKNGSWDFETRILNTTLIENLIKCQPEFPRDSELFILTRNQFSNESEPLVYRWIAHRDARIKEVGKLMITDVPLPC